MERNILKYRESKSLLEEYFENMDFLTIPCKIKVKHLYISKIVSVRNISVQVFLYIAAKWKSERDCERK